MIRVLIADDHEVVRRGIRAILDEVEGITVIAEASSGPEAVRAARELHADVVLMDIRMPGGDGITATDRLAGPEIAEPIPVIIMTSYDADEYLFGALESGAAGFLPKNARPQELLDAVRSVAAGDGFVAPEVIRRVMAEFVRRRPGTPASAAPDQEEAKRRAAVVTEAGLTHREVEVVVALCAGLNNAEIARRLSVDAGTVRNHLSRVMKKLELHNRMQVISWAFRVGLVE